jgi:hypothetical protein
MNTITANDGGVTFAGPIATRLYQVTAIKRALELYAKSKIMVNRAYTPKNMLATAGALTGK